MIQNIALLVSFLILSVFSLKNDQNITVTMDAPDQVQAGEEMLVTLNLKKGSIESFSRFTQTLPYGLTAERISTANADFSFEEQRLRIIWLKLPPEDSLEVKYRIKVNPRLTGNFNLEGEFAFVEENQRKTMPVTAGHVINIIPNPEVAENQRIDIDAFQELALANADGNLEALEVVRSEPVKSGAFEYTIDLRIKKGDLSKFAKVEEYIPEGYRVVEGDSKEAKKLWKHMLPYVMLLHRISGNPLRYNTVVSELMDDRPEEYHYMHYSTGVKFWDPKEVKKRGIMEKWYGNKRTLLDLEKSYYNTDYGLLVSAPAAFAYAIKHGLNAIMSDNIYKNWSINTSGHNFECTRGWARGNYQMLYKNIDFLKFQKSFIKSLI